MPSEYALVAALWAAMTYIWPELDTVPYLTITSSTKRSGKTLFADLIANVASNARNVGGLTTAVIARLIRDEHAVLFVDEAETLSGKSSSDVRSMLNMGYKAGQTWPRTGRDGQLEHWPVFCPKAFILIGDLTDTLRDRSIMFRMARGNAPERYVSRIGEPDGAALGARLQEWFHDHKEQVLNAYFKHDGLDFLPARDAEIWLSLFAVCSVLAPDRMSELRRAAVDLATEKTMARTIHTSLEMDIAEEQATSDEYAEKLVRDLLTVMGKAKSIYTGDALTALYALDVAPWRKFRGVGLTAIDMGNLLKRFPMVTPKPIRTGSKGTPTEKVARGYRREDVEKAVRSL
jgi:hypothetical protein